MPDPTGSDRPESPQNLKPKEHGAYAIVAIPLVSGLAVSGLNAVSACVAMASLTGFLANEPLLVVLGHRGERARRISPAATRRLAYLLALTVGFGILAVVQGSDRVRISLGLCLVLAAACFLVGSFAKHRTLSGQLLGVAGLSSPCVPILLSSDLETGRAIVAWGCWLLGFMSTTVAVRGVIAAQKRKSRLAYWAIESAIALAAVAWISLGKELLITAVLPMLLGSFYLLIHPPPARFLKRVGWGLVTVTLISATIMTAMLITTTPPDSLAVQSPPPIARL